MAVIKHKQRVNYTVTPNYIYNKSGLSFGAIGLLCTLLSKPENYKIHKTTFIKKKNDDGERPLAKATKHEINKLFKELVESGYLEIKTERDPTTGKIITNEWIVCDYGRQTAENDSNMAATPGTGFTGHRFYRAPVRQPLISKDNIISTNSIKSTKKTYGVSDEEILEIEKEKAEIVGKELEDFNTFWGWRTLRLGSNSKSYALKWWFRRMKEGYDPEKLIMAHKFYNVFCIETGIDGTRVVMQASTFIGEKKYFEQNWEEQANAARATKPKTVKDHAREFRATHGISQSYAAY